MRLLLANEKGGTTLPSVLQQYVFVTNAPDVTVAPNAPRVCREEEGVFFLFFLLDEG
jgi:hypothetical protein